MKNKLLLLTLSVLILFGVFYVFQQSDDTLQDINLDNTNTNITTQIKIGGPKNISMLPLIAKSKGYFKEKGIDVEFVPIQTGKIAQDSLISGDIDVAVLVETNIAFMAYRGIQDIKVLATIEAKTDDAIVARADRGIKQVSDLLGKKVGYLPATTSHVYLSRLLKKHNIREDQLELLSMPPPSMQAALINGDIDAMSLWQPFRFNAINSLKDKSIEFNDSEVYKAYALLASKEDYISNHKDELKLVLEALMEAEKFVINNPAEAINILSNNIPINESILTKFWSEYDLQVKLEADLDLILLEEGNWIRSTQKGFLDKEIPDYSKSIDASILNEIDSKRVTVTISNTQ